MFAVLTHEMLKANLVPFFDLGRSTIARLDSFFRGEERTFIRGNSMSHLCWCVGSTKRVIELDDDSVHTMANVNPYIVLCGWHGLPIQQNRPIELFATIADLENYMLHLHMSYLTSRLLVRKGRGRYFYLSFQVRRPSDEIVCDDKEQGCYMRLPKVDANAIQ